MANPLAGLPLEYRIGTNNSPGKDGYATEPGYDATKLPIGAAIAYVNRRDEKNSGQFAPYKPADDIEEQYDEPAPVALTEGFWANLDQQFEKWRQLGFVIAEIDNIDTDDVDVALQIFDHAQEAYGLSVVVKNPDEVDGPDPQRLLKHPAAVGVIIEKDCGTPNDAHALRVLAGKPDMPIRFVAYGDGREWAERMAEQITEGQYRDMGVTYSPQGEYKTVEHILRPVMATPSPPQASPCPWVDDIDDDIGRYHDGPDVPALAQQVGRVFPDHASYAALAGNSTAWCGIYVANKLSRYQIEPPYSGEPDVHSWMYVDSWLELKGGTRLQPSQKRDGDLALWMGSDLHHISFVYGNGYLGGNQSNTVNISNFRTPDAIIRPPPPASYVPTPEAMPMLMIGSHGEDVRTLQIMLNEQNNAGLEVDGDFGPDTEQAVKNYQTKYNLEVDGIVGPETWDCLFEHAGEEPTPQPPPAGALSTEQVLAIIDMADASEIAHYSWKDRGRAPIGYTEGLAVMFAQCLMKLQAQDSAVLAMTEPIGFNSKDALAYYGVQASGRENVLRELFVMLYGLGMRESSGNYTEGRDMSASNVSADTAEAGLFQQSWNSSGASNEMKKLLPAYDDGSQPCYAKVFERGITKKDTDSYGSPSSDGYKFQELAKSCPAFATEMCGVGLRVLYNHWGPIVRQEAEMRAEADALLRDVAAYMQEPIPEPQPPTDVEAAKAACMASIEVAVDKLIADLLATNEGKKNVAGDSRGSGSNVASVH